MASAIQLLRSVSLPLAIALLGGCAPSSSSVYRTTGAVVSPPASRGTTQTILLVHGAWADGSSFDRIVPILQRAGYNVVALHQPLTSVADDVAATRRMLDAEPGDVVLVGHSYGGAVITIAGAHDKVRALVYVDAFAPDAGESINDLGKGKPKPPWLPSLRIDGGGYARLPIAAFAQDFAQDLPASEVSLLAAKQGPFPMKAFDEKTTVAAWRMKPSWYVIGTNDRMIAPEEQTVMAARIQARVTTIFGASHAVILSQPDKVAQVILAAATATAR
jgi:pimeloyl-ACP methyl ester carboxylesterase